MNTGAPHRVPPSSTQRLIQPSPVQSYKPPFRVPPLKAPCSMNSPRILNPLRPLAHRLLRIRFVIYPLDTLLTDAMCAPRLGALPMRRVHRLFTLFDVS